MREHGGTFKKAYEIITWYSNKWDLICDSFDYLNNLITQRHAIRRASHNAYVTRNNRTVVMGR